jgi:hypothetical protein
MAVQVFLVIGGFLAARSLAPAPPGVAAAPALCWCRTLPETRHALPRCRADRHRLRGHRARPDGHDSIPGRPTLPQVVAHALLLQSILGYEGLSAGVWYIAIDFQLFAPGRHAVAGTHPGSRHTPACGSRQRLTGRHPGSGLTVHFNRDADWDIWGVYFFAAYALGNSDLLGNQPQKHAWLAGCRWSVWWSWRCCSTIVRALPWRCWWRWRSAWHAATAFWMRWPRSSPDCLPRTDFLLGLSRSLSRSAC